MKRIKYFLVLLTFQFAFSSALFCQSFEVSTLIDIPGDNIEFDVLSPSFHELLGETYICWINKIDSIYTVYLKQIGPDTGENVIVASDESIKSNPQIAINRYDQGIKIVWQSYVDNIWNVYLKYFNNNQLSDSLVLLDSLNAEPQISLSIHRIAWINNGNLFVKEFYPNLSSRILFDSLNCASPDLFMDDLLDATKVVYEKNYVDSIKINCTEYYRNGTSPPVFTNNTISKGLFSRYPKFGQEEAIAFQTLENAVWKAEYSVYNWNYPEITTNTNCNYYNPVVFSYPIPTSSPTYTPFFVAFDTDSFANSNEIFIKTFLYGEQDSLLNISQNAGDDYKPKVTYLSSTDSLMVALIWLHNENNKTDIWVAKDKFNPVPGAVDDERNSHFGFVLSQNYPNPFNPTSTIKYEILRSGFVRLSVFDLLGKEVANLINEYKPIGNYSVEFNASNLSSGIYYYQIKHGDFIDTKKMMLLK